MFHPWSSGNDRTRRFGCREIKVPSAPIFLTQFTDMLFGTVTNAFLTYLLNST